MATTTNLGLNKPARTDNINVVTAINNNMDALDAAIGALPSGSNLQTEVSGKADKVASPTNGNFAGLDGNGNLTDSGKKAADFATASEVGTVPSGKTVQGQITDIESSIGTVPSGKTVEGQISEINTTVGSMIDDTSTANNKVWSAQKVNDLKSAIDATLIHDSVSNQSIATIPDGADGLPVEQLIVGIEPVQDLHGQSNPYPGGGGANKLDLEAYIKSRTNDYSVDANGWITINDMSTAGLYANHWAVGPFTNGSCMILIDSSRTTATNVRLRIYNNGSGIETAAKFENKQFDEIGFNWGSSGKATIKVSCVDATTISEWTPYSNICPISGYSSAEVVRTGKNLIDKTAIETGFIQSSDGVVNPNANMRHTDYIRLAQGQSYTVSGSGWTGSNTGAFYNVNKEFVSGFNPYTLPNTFTPPSGACYIRLSLEQAYVDTAQVEIGSSASAHEAYQGVAKTYSFPTPPGTVYGGTLTVNADGTGQLVVDRAEVDLGSLTWSKANDYFVVVGSDLPDNFGFQSYSFTSPGNLICSQYKTIAWNVWTSSDKCIALNDTYFAIKDSTYSSNTASAFKTAMSGVQMVYELANPVTYNLTNLEVIETLKGINNVWADTGNTSIDYPADTKLYIAKVIASLS